MHEAVVASAATGCPNLGGWTPGPTLPARPCEDCGGGGDGVRIGRREYGELRGRKKRFTATVRSLVRGQDEGAPVICFHIDS
nr:unnamed protein product [Digitaria exilis]